MTKKIRTIYVSSGEEIRIVNRLDSPIETIGIAKAMAHIGTKSRTLISDLIATGVLKIAPNCKRKTLLFKSVEDYRLKYKSEIDKILE